MTSRKVTHYFDEHRITIVSSAPLADILNNPGATGRVAEWNIELSPHDLQFKHPTQSKLKYSQTFWSNGRKSKHLDPQTYPTHGQCSSTGQKDNKELE